MKESSFFSKIKAKIKDAKKPVKLDRTLERDNRKKVVFFTWSIVAFVVFCSAGAFFISFSGLKNNAKATGTTVAKQSAEELNYPAVENYLNPFIDNYMNVGSDLEKNIKRQEELARYLVQSDEDNTKLFEVGQVSGERLLQQKKVYSVKKKQDSIQVQYIVDYQNITSNEREVVKKVKVANKDVLKKEKVTDKKVEPKTAVLTVNIIEKGGVYAIEGAPYFSNVYPLKGEIKKKEKSEEGEVYTGSKMEKIESFATDFFTKYTTASVADLTYIMKQPESVNNVYTLDSIEALKIYQEKELFRVETMVVFVDSSGVTSKQAFSIVLSEKNGHFYVEELKHK